MNKKIIAAGIVMTAFLFVLAFFVDKIFYYPALIAAMILMHLGIHERH